MQPESGCLFNRCLFSICLFGNYFHTHYQTQTQHSLLPPPTTNPSPLLITTATCHECPPWAKRHVGPTSAATLHHAPRVSNNGYTATTCHVTTTETTTLTPNSHHQPRSLTPPMPRAHPNDDNYCCRPLQHPVPCHKHPQQQPTTHALNNNLQPIPSLVSQHQNQNQVPHRSLQHGSQMDDGSQCPPAPMYHP